MPTPAAGYRGDRVLGGLDQLLSERHEAIRGAGATAGDRVGGPGDHVSGYHDPN